MKSAMKLQRFSLMIQMNAVWYFLTPITITNKLFYNMLYKQRHLRRWNEGENAFTKQFKQRYQCTSGIQVILPNLIKDGWFLQYFTVFSNSIAHLFRWWWLARFVLTWWSKCCHRFHLHGRWWGVGWNRGGAISCYFLQGWFVFHRLCARLAFILNI